ncbi:TM2 domain-containing protein [Streptomyces endophyticus]|uniref:TM2 domain-containing protein n=1 Tax=Streptomyces endophyticus TaxID=714166 RepID=A0ABU6FH80_9ACTN|nr:TM2 domain-containing protein [Streptomyces endophyticus]MEB8343385.1 TM2 domain-containing protein [Streptomyces endophyticus]
MSDNNPYGQPPKDQSGGNPYNQPPADQPGQPYGYPQQGSQPGYGTPPPGQPGQPGQPQGQPGYGTPPPGQPGPPQGQPGQPGQPSYGYPYPGSAPAGGGAYPPPPGPGMGAPNMGPGMGMPYDPAAPYGYDPYGRPYSDKTKLAAGLLGIFLGSFGAGRFYTGHTGMAVTMLIVSVVTCGLGGIWGLIDGIMMLAGGNATDSQGRLLRDS